MKTRAFAAAAAIAALALAGCGGDSKDREDVTVPGGSGATSAPTTPEGGETAAPTTDAPEASSEDEVLNRTIDYLWSGASYRQEGSMEVSVIVGGQTIANSVTFTNDYIPEPLQMDMTMATSTEGLTQEIRMVMVPEDANTRVYVSDLAEGSWMTYTMTPEEAADSGLGAVDPMNQALQGLGADAEITRRDLPASPETNGEAAYEITIVLPSNALTEIVSANAGGAIDSFEGSGTVVYVVAADDGQPFTATVNIDGVLTAGGESGDFATTNHSVFSNWNELTEITVPAEALDAVEVQM